MDRNKVLFTERFSAMGTGASVDLVLEETDKAEAERIFSGVRSIFSREEKRFSRFDPESELSKLNLQAGEMSEISEEMGEVLERAIEFSERFPGIFDPRVLETLENIGYDRDFKKFDPGEERMRKESGGKINGCFSESLELIKNDPLKVSFRERIDLSGIVKGWCVDRAAEYIEKEGHSDFIVEAGGDMFVSGNGEDGRPWRIVVEGLEEGADLGISGAAVATSGISRRRWSGGGKKFHHLIDPRNPDAFRHNLKSVTVIAGSTEEADVLAKVLFLEGKEAGLERAEKENIPCLFLDYNNHAYVSAALKKFTV